MVTPIMESNSRYIGLNGRGGNAPWHWASNEAWPTDVINHLANSPIESAVLVGSANFCSVAPSMPDLREVAFVDLEPGHSDLARSRVLAAKDAFGVLNELGNKEQASSYLRSAYTSFLDHLQPYLGMAEIAALLDGESKIFDVERNRLGTKGGHYLATLDRLAAASRLDVDGDLELSETLLDITNPNRANLLRTKASAGDRLGWVHVSNVAPVSFPAEVRGAAPTRRCVDGAVTRTAMKVIDFVGGIKGADDETLVTFSNFGINYLSGPSGSIFNAPTVSIARLGSLAPESLIVEGDILECLSR